MHHLQAAGRAGMQGTGGALNSSYTNWISFQIQFWAFGSVSLLYEHIFGNTLLYFSIHLCGLNLSKAIESNGIAIDRFKPYK